MNSTPNTTLKTYFIQGEKTGLIKIGESIDPMDRIMTLQVGSPDKLIMLKFVDSNTYPENELHQRFKHSRRHGEWFYPDPDLIRFINLLKPFVEAKSPDLSTENQEDTQNLIEDFCSAYSPAYDIPDSDFYSFYKDYARSKGIDAPMSKTQLAVACKAHGIARSIINTSGNMKVVWRSIKRNKTKR